MDARAVIFTNQTIDDFKRDITLLKKLSKKLNAID